MTPPETEQALAFEFPDLPVAATYSKRPQPTAFQDQLDLSDFVKFSASLPASLEEPTQLTGPVEDLARSSRSAFATLDWRPTRKGSAQESSGSGSFVPSRSSLIASNSMLPSPEGLPSVRDGQLLDTAPSSSKIPPVRISREVHHRGTSSSRSSAEEADHNQQVSHSQPQLDSEDLQDGLEPGSPEKLTDKMKRRLYLKEDPNYPNLSEKDRRRIRRRIANRESARRVRQKREDQLSDAQKQAMSYKAETVRLRQYVVKLEEQGRLLAKEAMHWRTKWTQSNYQSMQMYNELSATSRGGMENSNSQAGPHHPMEMTSQGIVGAAPGQQAPRPRLPKAQTSSPAPVGHMTAQAPGAGIPNRAARASPYQGQPAAYDMSRSQPMYPHELSHLAQAPGGHQFDTAPLDVRMPSFGGSLSALDRLLWPTLTEPAEGEGQLNNFAEQ